MVDYATKYAIAGLKHIDPFSITDPDECDWLMFALDNTIANITDQLDQEHAASMAEGSKIDWEWATSAKRALRGTKATRAAIQNRKGVLTREKKARSSMTMERAFVDLARKSLPAETFQELWSRVFSENPHLGNPA